MNVRDIVGFKYLPNEKDIDEVLERLPDSDAEYARSCADYTSAKLGLPIAKAKGQPDTGTIAEKERVALQSDVYTQAKDKLVEAEFKRMQLMLERERLIMTVDVWRSINANQRKS
jgi:hypothetical protein